MSAFQSLKKGLSEIFPEGKKAASTISERLLDQVGVLKRQVGEFAEANPEIMGNIKKAGTAAAIGGGLGFASSFTDENSSALHSALMGATIGGVGAGIHQRVRTTRINNGHYTKQLTKADETIYNSTNRINKLNRDIGHIDKRSFLQKMTFQNNMSPKANEALMNKKDEILDLKQSIRSAKESIKSNEKLEQSPLISHWKWGAGAGAATYASNLLSSNAPINPSPM